MVRSSTQSLKESVSSSISRINPNPNEQTIHMNCLPAPFKRMVISFVNTGFTFRWIYPKLFSPDQLPEALREFSFARLLSAGDSLSLCAAQIPTLSVHRFAIHLSGTFFIPNIVYAVRPDLSRIFLMTAFCIRRSLRIQPGNLPLPHCSHKWLSAHRSPAMRFPALFL